MIKTVIVVCFSIIFNFSHTNGIVRIIQQNDNPIDVFFTVDVVKAEWNLYEYQNDNLQIQNRITEIYRNSRDNF